MIVWLFACGARPPDVPPQPVPADPPPRVADAPPVVPPIPRGYAPRACEVDADCALVGAFPCTDSPCGACPVQPALAVHRASLAEAEAGCRAWVDGTRALQAWRDARPVDGPRAHPTPPNCGPCQDPGEPQFSGAACVERACVAVPIP